LRGGINIMKNFYLKAFLTGFLIAFITIFISHYEKDFISLMAIFYGLISGILFIIMAFIHSIISKDQSLNNEDIFKVKHYKELVLELPEFEVINRIKNFINDNNYKIIEEKDKKISCKTPMNLKSFGTLLTFQIEYINNNTILKISSRPYIPTTIIDFGDSLSVINKAEKYLSQTSHSTQLR